MMMMMDRINMAVKEQIFFRRSFVRINSSRSIVFGG